MPDSSTSSAPHAGSWVAPDSKPAESATERRIAQHWVAHQTGIVITVYLGAQADLSAGIALLSDTVEAFCHVVVDPQHIVLSVDGPGPGVAAAQQVAATYGVDAVYAQNNGGKLAAARLGMARLLDHANGRANDCTNDRTDLATSLRYFALVDQDGDHFANELLNLARAAQHVTTQTGSPHVVVMGSRLARHRSLGLLRAAGEELASRILLDALQHHAAQTSTPLPLQYVAPLEAVPDFHAGYKLFSREIATAVFSARPQLAGCDEATYFRHAIEAVMVVEAVAAGATLAAVSRRAYDEQPMSIFAQIDRARLTADLIIWPCKRLQIPGPFVAQWLANHLPCLPLATLLPQGRDELQNVARLVHAAFELPPPPTELARPRFI